MMLKISLLMGVILVLFLAYVSTRPGEFKYERSGLINATPEKIFSYISNFKLGSQWNTFDQKDPQVKRNFIGTDGQVGSILEFDGNREAGSGKLEILKVVPNQSVLIKLSMTKPMAAENTILYTLTPEGTATRFTWTMSGDAGFPGKLVSVFIDCEKMVAGDFEKSIQQLKTIVESQK